MENPINQYWYFKKKMCKCNIESASVSEVEHFMNTCKERPSSIDDLNGKVGVKCLCSSACMIK